jgi:hypothetical protein
MTRSQWTIPHVMNRTWPNREQRAPSASNRTLPTPSRPECRCGPSSTHPAPHTPRHPKCDESFPAPYRSGESCVMHVSVNKDTTTPLLEHRKQCNRSEGNTQACSQAMLSNPTTGFLTATTFIYALGAGITAAAGTRLALQ